MLFVLFAALIQGGGAGGLRQIFVGVRLRSSKGRLFSTNDAAYAATVPRDVWANSGIDTSAEGMRDPKVFLDRTLLRRLQSGIGEGTTTALQRSISTTLAIHATSLVERRFLRILRWQEKEKEGNDAAGSAAAAQPARQFKPIGTRSELGLETVTTDSLEKTKMAILQGREMWRTRELQTVDATLSAQADATRPVLDGVRSTSTHPVSKKARVLNIMGHSPGSGTRIASIVFVPCEQWIMCVRAYEALAKRAGFKPKLFTVDNWPALIDEYQRIFNCLTMQDLGHFLRRTIATFNKYYAHHGDLCKSFTSLFQFIKQFSIDNIDNMLVTGKGLRPGCRIPVPTAAMDGAKKSVRVVKVPVDAAHPHGVTTFTSVEIQRMKDEGCYWSTFSKALARERKSEAVITAGLLRFWRNQFDILPAPPNETAEQATQRSLDMVDAFDIVYNYPPTHLASPKRDSARVFGITPGGGPGSTYVAGPGGDSLF